MSKQKKIMLLGGIYYLKPVIEVAHNLGYYVITADYLPNNVAHQWSDEFVNVSILDKERVLEIAKQKDIDGIMSFAVDPGVVTAAYVAEQLGLPSAGPYESVKILQDKARFRKFLFENGFNVPWAKGYSNMDQVMADINEIKFPAIVKPVDSAGSKGVSRVDGASMLPDAISFAQRYSHTNGEFIIEEFIECEGAQSGSDSFSIDGQMVFVSFDDQHFETDSLNPYVPSSHTWPSTMSMHAQCYLKNEIQRVVTLLGMRTTLYNIEARVGKNGTPYIMEMAPRAGGNRISELLELASGVELIKASIQAAVGENISLEPFKMEDCWANVVVFAETNGKFAGLKIDSTVMKHVKNMVLYKKVGEELETFNAANTAIGSIFLCYDNKKDLENVINHRRELIQVRML